MYAKRNSTKIDERKEKKGVRAGEAEEKRKGVRPGERWQLPLLKTCFSSHQIHWRQAEWVTVRLCIKARLTLVKAPHGGSEKLPKVRVDTMRLLTVVITLLGYT